jgi:hypothetical protein
MNYSYLPILYEDRQAFEVIDPNGRSTGIIRDTAQSANGVAQTINTNVRRLLKQRTRVESRN